MIYTTLISEDPVSIYSQISADSEPDTRTDVSQEIQARIDALQDIISACEDKIIQWKRFKNSAILPVSRLPHEVLAHVFLHLRSMETRQDKGMLSWMVVTHVCSRWRNAALECPELWDRPYFGNLEYAMEMIARAKSSPLELVILNGGRTFFYLNDSQWVRTKIYRPSCPTEAAKLAFANMHRARRLYLLEESSALITSGHTGLGVPGGHRYPWELNEWRAPSLQQLTLATSSRNQWENFSPIQFPFDRLLKYAPKLRHLYLKNWTLNSSASGLLDHLTDLEIALIDTNCHPRPVDQRTPAGIISVLRDLKNLKNLRLHDITVFQTHPSWNHDLPDEFPVPEHAELSRLQRLEIQDHFRSCLRILEGIHYPSSTSVDIKTSVMRSYSFGSDTSSDLLRLEATEVAASLQLFASRLEAPVMRLSIRFADIDSGRRWGYDPATPIESNQLIRCSFSYAIPRTTCGDSQLTWLNVDAPLRVGISLLPRICSYIPLYALQELHSSLPYSDVEFWLTIGRLPSIETLTVEHTTPPLLFTLSASGYSPFEGDHTHRPQEELEPYSPSFVSFPALRRLTMQGWHFAKSDGSDLWAYPRAKASLPDLIRSLSARYKQTNVSVKLNLHDCPGIIESNITDIIDKNGLNPDSLHCCVTHQSLPGEDYAEGKATSLNPET